MKVTVQKPTSVAATDSLFSLDGIQSLIGSQNSFYRNPLFHSLHRTGCVLVMNEDAIIKEKGFCFVPAFKTVNKIMPCKRKDGGTNQAGPSTYWDK